MIRTSFVQIAALTIALTAVCPARGAEPPEASASSSKSDEADALFRRGNDLYKEQRYAEAKSMYEMALGLKKSHDIAANLGYAELKLKQYRDAAEHLAFAVDNWPPTVKGEKRRFAEERLAAAKQEVAMLTVEVNVTGATVLIDGKEVRIPRITRRVFVEPGPRTIEAKLSGYKDAKQMLQTAKGAELAVSLQLEALPPEPVVHAPPPEPVWWRRRDPRIIVAGGATAGAALIAGVIFTVAANGEASDAEEKEDALARKGVTCPRTGATGECLAVQDAHATKDTLSNVAFWSFVGAGAVAAGTLVYAFMPELTPEPSGLRAAPVVTAHGGGLAISGAF
jgi:tetratricopeptide (TPR) repeat protein